MVTDSIFTTENIHKMYLQWMHEEENNSVRKDRFVSLLEGISPEKQYQIEQWIVSAFAIGLECGYNVATTDEVGDIL